MKHYPPNNFGRPPRAPNLYGLITIVLVLGLAVLVVLTLARF